MAFTTFQATPFSEGAPFVLNSGGIALATGFRVRMGDGTQSGLFITTTGMGVHNGSFATTFTTAATAARTVAWPDGSLTFPAAGGRVCAENIAVLASDATNSTTTEAAIASFSVTLAAATTYEFEALLVCQSASTTTGLQLALAGPTSEVSFVVYEVSFLTGTTLATGNRSVQMLNAFATYVSATAAPAAATNFLVLVKGMLKTTTTPATPLSFNFKSEVGASTVTVKAGSVLKVKPLN